jgi:hypothetical protein
LHNRVLQKIEAFMKKNYCGESPFGEGSDDSCDLRNRKKRNGNIKVIADYDCEWNETKNESECKQQGQVSPGLRTILVHQLEGLGMPAKAPGEIYFKVWQPNRADWLVAQSINRTAPELTLTCARWSRSLTRIVE